MFDLVEALFYSTYATEHTEYDSYYTVSPTENEFYHFHQDDIEELILALIGNYEGVPYHWIIRLKSGIFVYLHGSCYGDWSVTGNLDSHRFETLDQAISFNKEIERELFNMINSNITVKTWNKYKGKYE